MFEQKMSTSGPVSNPLVSIVIPTYNSMTGDKNIEKTLESIMAQTYQTIEVLVVDNHSKDRTYQVCKNYSVNFFQLECTRSDALNYGMDKMSGDYVLFMGSDFVLAPRVVEECVSKSLDANADCIIVPVRFVSNKKACIDCSKMRNLEQEMQLGMQSFVLFYSKELIRNVRFPRNVQLGEDMIFSSAVMELKPLVARIESFVYHAEKGTVRSLIIRSWNYGRVFRLTIQEISAKRSTRLILGLSPLNINKVRRVMSVVSRTPETAFSFLIYTALKHSSFALSYLLSLFERRQSNVL